MSRMLGRHREEAPQAGCGVSWFKVDDKLHEHRKSRIAGAPAMGLWVMAGSWCGDNLTDGFVPDCIAARWDRSYRRLAERLVDAGFWDVDEVNGEPGWRFRNWSEFQPTRAQVEDERRAARERMAAVRAKRSPERSDDVRPNFGGSSDDVRSTRPDPSRRDPLPPVRQGRQTKRDPDLRPPIPDVAEVLALRAVEEPTRMPDDLRNRRMEVK